jgi:hypothetical protein
LEIATVTMIPRMTTTAKVDTIATPRSEWRPAGISV